jgi:uncharacterized protein YfaT (DUF1175 family)
VRWLPVLWFLAGCGEPRVLRLRVEPPQLPANGYATARLVADAPEVQFRVVAGHRHVRVESGIAAATVIPGVATIEAAAKNYRRATVRIETTPVASDRAGDGTPDFLRLDDPSDRDAFREWFTLLAEAQQYETAAEITDCAALLRFAYREALRTHDAEWAERLRLPPVALPRDVRRYAYPFTPLGAALFRVRAGPFRADDVRDGAFAEFADAQTLMRRNTHFVSRDLARAVPGDLLFYRQLEQELPFHAMVVLGHSHFAPSAERWIVYHTGPLGKTRGEVRRPTYAQLRAHPSPQWRPTPGNPNFLGVYRWNILRETD